VGLQPQPLVKIKKNRGFTVYIREDVGGSEKSRLVGWLTWKCFSAFSADTVSQLDVIGHDRHSLGVDGVQVGVLKQTDQA